MVDSPVSDDEEDFEQRRDKFRSERDEISNSTSNAQTTTAVTSTNDSNVVSATTPTVPTTPSPSIIKGSTVASSPSSSNTITTPSSAPVAPTVISPSTATSTPTSVNPTHKRLASQRDERSKSPEYKRSGADRGSRSDRGYPRSPPRRDYEGRPRYPPRARENYDREREYEMRGEWDPRDRDPRRDPRDREWDPRDREYWDRELYEREMRERERYRGGRDHRDRDFDRYREDRRPDIKRRRDDWGRPNSPGHSPPPPLPPPLPQPQQMQPQQMQPQMVGNNRYIEHEAPNNSNMGPKSHPYHHTGYRPSQANPYRMEKKRRKSVREDDSLYEGPLKTYKQFLETQDDNIQPGEAQKRFEEYQLEYKWRQAKTFFNDHKNSEWFKEKYHPTYLEKSKVEKAALCKQNAVQFVEEYSTGNFRASLSAEDVQVIETATPTQPKKDEEKVEEKKEETEVMREDDEEEEEDEDSEDTHHRKVIKESSLDNQAINSEANLVQRTIFVKTIPPHWGKAELTEHLNSVEDCKIIKITFSEPNRQKGFHRLAWVTYESEAQANKVIAELNGKKFKDFDLLLGVNKPSDKEKAKKARATPPLFCSEERMKTDLEQAKTLAKIFDEQREIKENPLFSFEFDGKYRTLKEKLDVFITYLRRVHIFCYYCGEDYEHADDMARKCGTIHYRSNTPLSSINENAWISTWEMKIQEHLSGSAFGRDSIERYLEDFYGEYTKKIEEAKYACGFCNKLFKGPQFIKKHINLKHPEQVEERKGKAIEEQFFLNYFNDPRKLLPLPSPVTMPLPQSSHMKQPLPQPPQINLSNINVSLSNAGALSTLHALTGVQVVANLMNQKQSMPQPPIPPIPPPLPQPHPHHIQQHPLHPPTPPVPPMPPHLMPRQGRGFQQQLPMPPSNMLPLPMPPMPPSIVSPSGGGRSRGNWSWRRGDREEERGEERPRHKVFPPGPPMVRPSYRPAPLPLDPRAAEFGGERRLLEYVDLDAPEGEQEDFGAGFFDWGKVIEKHKSSQSSKTTPASTTPASTPTSTPISTPATATTNNNDNIKDQAQPSNSQPEQPTQSSQPVIQSSEQPATTQPTEHPAAAQPTESSPQDSAQSTEPTTQITQATKQLATQATEPITQATEPTTQPISVLQSIEHPLLQPTEQPTPAEEVVQ